MRDPAMARVPNRPPEAGAPASEPRGDSLLGSASRPQHVVGIGELKVSSQPSDVIVTHALGSCIAICLWDRATPAAGLLHFLLPDSRVNRARASEQPAAFADTAIPLLVEAMKRLAPDPRRWTVRLVGGADINGLGGMGPFNVGKRNIQAARSVLWKLGLFVEQEAVGGSAARTVHLFVGDGRLQISSGRDIVGEL